MLTAKTISAFNPRASEYPVADANGLAIIVLPNARKVWRYRYRFAGKAKTLTLGDFPAVSIARARELRTDAAKLLRSGRDPSTERKAATLRNQLSSAATFRAVAEEWLAIKHHDWTEKNEVKERGRLMNHVFPWIGDLPIVEVGAAEVRGILDRIVKHRNTDTAHRVRQTMACVFRYAIAHDRVERNPAEALRDHLPAHRKQQFAHITDPALLGELLRAIHGYSGQYVTACALKLAPLVFLRPGELRQGEWAEVDLKNALWTIPARRMKLNKAGKLDPNSPPHFVPLSSQAVAILRELHALTGNGKMMFPGVRDCNKPMSNATMNAALKRMGFDTDTIQPHGFRHTASTALNEMGFDSEAIERQLSHHQRGIAGVYNKAKYMPERYKMMQAWADYLDSLRAPNNVVKLARNTRHVPGSSSIPRAQSAPARRARR